MKDPQSLTIAEGVYLSLAGVAEENGLEIILDGATVTIRDGDQKIIEVDVDVFSMKGMGINICYEGWCKFDSAFDEISVRNLIDELSVQMCQVPHAA